MLDFDFQARSGEFALHAAGRQDTARMGLFGPSGCGKSTLLRAVGVNVVLAQADAVRFFLDEHPDAGVVAPKLLNTDLTDQGTARAFPSPAAAIAGLP